MWSVRHNNRSNTIVAVRFRRVPGPNRLHKLVHDGGRADELGGDLSAEITRAPQPGNPNASASVLTI